METILVYALVWFIPIMNMYIFHNVEPNYKGNKIIYNILNFPSTKTRFEP